MKSLNSLSASRSRCTYKSRSGRPCRYSALPHVPFCKRHAPLPLLDVPSDYDALAAELAEAAGDFSSPAQVQNVMGRIFHALIRRRISPKEAGVLCYIAQTILHSHRVILLELKLKTEAKKRRTIHWINDLPTADRSGPSEDPGSGTSTGDVPSPTASQPSIPDPSSAIAAPAPNSQEDISSVHPGEQSPPESKSPPDSSRATASTAKPAVPPPVVPPPMPPGYLNHFYPRDPTLPPGLQDPEKLAPPPPSQAELDRRNARFARIHGYRR